MTTASYTCERCRDTGEVFVRAPSEFDVHPITTPQRCPACAARDGENSYKIGLAAKREKAVRSDVLPPLNDRERRQQDEGPRDWGDLDCVRGR